MRPYATIEAFLAEERDTFSRTAVTLIGAPTRPRGVVIRFEVTLSNGTPVLRGEGRVLGFQAADDQGPSSLTLRFTRLDARSKALVDRAAELRENRESSIPPEPRPTDAGPAPSSPESGPTLTAPAAFPPPGESSPALTPVDAPPPQRDALLDRLRARAKTLSPGQIETILTPRQRR
jgi:molecular chaperone DnaK